MVMKSTDYLLHLLLHINLFLITQPSDFSSSNFLFLKLFDLLVFWYAPYNCWFPMALVRVKREVLNFNNIHLKLLFLIKFSNQNGNKLRDTFLLFPAGIKNWSFSKVMILWWFVNHICKNFCTIFWAKLLNSWLF